MIARRIPLRSLIAGTRAAIAFGFALIMAPTFVFADAQISGSSQSVRIEARDSSVEEVLAGLDNALNVRHRSSVKLDNRLNGTYEGSLQSVIKRILAGYDFFVKTENGEVEVTILRSPTAPLGTAASPSFRVSDRPTGVSPAQPPPALAAAEPPVPSAVTATIPAQPPPASAAVEPHRRSAAAAPSFRRRHREHYVASQTGSRPSPPHKIKVAGRASPKGNFHARSNRFAHGSIFYCNRSCPFGLVTMVPTPPRYWSRPWSLSWPRWEAPCCASGIVF